MYVIEMNLQLLKGSKCSSVSLMFQYKLFKQMQLFLSVQVFLKEHFLFHSVALCCLSNCLRFAQLCLLFILLMNV